MHKQGPTGKDAMSQVCQDPVSSEASPFGTNPPPRDSLFGPVGGHRLRSERVSCVVRSESSGRAPGLRLPPVVTRTLAWP
eukprot:contig_1230_g171